MQYGFINMRGFAVTTNNLPRLDAVKPHVEWCNQHESKGRYHYSLDYGGHSNTTVWKFELEKDAMFFALKFK